MSFLDPCAFLACCAEPWCCSRATLRKFPAFHVKHGLIWMQMSRRQEIANMLETAGFSKSNPYYIVEQGKVCERVRLTGLGDAGLAMRSYARIAAWQVRRQCVKGCCC